MLRLPEFFEQRERALLGERFAELFTPADAIRESPARGVTVNTLRTTPQAFAEGMDTALTPSPFCRQAFAVAADFRPGRHPWHHAGVFYAQEPSAASAAPLLDVRPGMRVCDLCAAPGGKSSQLAAALQGQGILLANEYVAARAEILRQNLERMGVPNAVVTNETPDRLAAALPGWFDRVLVDAPCSGEGMFRKEAAAIGQHGPALVAQCAATAAGILDAAAALLAPGGVLVLSTCTFAPEEDEGQAAAFLARHPEFVQEDLSGVGFGRPGEANRAPEVPGFSAGFCRRIWPADGGEGPLFSAVLDPVPVKITGLRNMDGKIAFTSDRTGVNEMYVMDPHTREIYRVTSTPYGAKDFQASPDRKSLYFSEATHDGAILSRTGMDSLMAVKVDFNERYTYKVAEKLSEQERQAAAGCPEQSGEVELQEPERYRKFPHLFNIHSWAPVYFDFDNISNLSYDYYYDLVSLGTAAAMQNSLGTFTANFGYSAHKDPYDRSFWRHSGHAKITYSGLYPVFEASIDVNDRASRINYLSISMLEPDRYLLSLVSEASGIPSVRGRIAAYIPFNFSSGGWYRGLIPQIAWSASNDLYIGKLDQKLTASVRAYTMLGTATSEIYPDWGIGIEGGISGYLGLSDYFSPAAYGYVYGYIPGFFTTHGFRFTATGQWQTRRDALFSSSIINTLPRGLSSDSMISSYMAGRRSSYKLTAEYAMPVYLGDFNITSGFYVKRAIITPHFDFTFFQGGSLYSAGVSAAVEFGRFFWVGTPIRIGVTYSYNGGRSFNALRSAGAMTGHHYVGPVFNISLPQ